MSEAILKRAKLSIGDELTVEDPYRDKKHTLRILGESKTSQQMVLFLPRKTLNRWLEQKEDYYNGVFSNQDPEISAKEAVIRTMGPEDYRILANELLKFLKSIVPSMIGLSVTVYLVVIFVLTKNILDRASMSIAYLQIFGYRREEISKIYLRVSAIAILIFQILLIPAEKILVQKLFFLSLLKFNGYIKPIVPTYAYVIPILLGIGTYYLIRIFQMRRIINTDMTEALKEHLG